MLSKNQLKFIQGLKKKKIRQSERLFLAEGVKVVEELLRSSFILHKLYFTEAYTNPLKVADYHLITDKELQLISDFSTPNQVLGIFEIPDVEESVHEGITVLLDEINDPGNLGTIIRLCDWFGVDQLVCSTNTVDCYNQKVVQASMGSLARVQVSYVDLISYLKEERRTIYGTFLNGDNVYQTDLDSDAVIILGNEANGISDKLSAMVNKKLTIPQFGQQQLTESLNVAMATAIFLSEFRK